MPRIAVIDKEGCLGKKCQICIKICPINRMGQDCIISDKEGFPIINEDLCTGCGICPRKCPTKVIKIINLKSEAGELIHQYGVNSFRLYNLPLPKTGVLGFIGENGTGKTTALSILSGNCFPNFGNYKIKASIEDAFDKFRGRELGNYFQRIRTSGEVDISIKEQNIEKFRSDTTVRLYFGINKKFEEIVEKLNISNVIDKKLSELSGGELQTVAIAKTMMIDAELYFFDEPCSFLDVHQRLVVAKAIRELSEKSNVIVVEHDLAVLDYLTDYINIFYGEPGAYGVVSNLKSSRTGVNEYLDGFLSDENMRIRKEPITFDLRGISEFTPGEKIIDYLEFRKELGDFIFKSKQGAVHENEIIGILGPNATGKTTFMKILAGVIQPDEGKFESSLKIAYKPQYLKPEVGFVKEIIELYDLNQEVFTEMKKKLGIEQLMEKECSKLSGGELQRFSIALTLSREADLYLLDEPSAFLDIEQRLSLSSILRSRIKEKKACFVVDHDVVFIDNVSDKIIVFDGVPGNSGRAGPSLKKRDAMNSFLKIMGVTMRRDKDTHRPRINKLDSVLDREQKEKGEYYYIA